MPEITPGQPVIKKRVAVLPSGATFYTPSTLSEWCRAHGEPYREFAQPQALSLRIEPILSSDQGAAIHLNAQSPAMFAGRVSNCRLVPHEGFVCTFDHHIIYEALGYKDGNPKEGLGGFCFGVDKAQRCVMVLPENAPNVAQECVFIGGIKNFGHFVIQNLLRLSFLDLLPEMNGLPIAVYAGLPNRFLEFLDLLGFPAARRITVAADVPTRFDKAWLVSSPMYRKRDDSTQIWPDAIRTLRAKLAEKFDAPVARPRVFISRANAAWRRMVNEKEILDIAEKFGVTPVDLGSVGAEEQIKAIAAAEIIVCLAGAASQITAFAPMDCAIIELAPPDWVGFFGPRAFAGALSQPYRRIVGTGASPVEAAAAGLPPLTTTNIYDRDYFIDRGEFEKQLDAADAKRKRN